MATRAPTLADLLGAMRPKISAVRNLRGEESFDVEHAGKSTTMDLPSMAATFPDAEAEVEKVKRDVAEAQATRPSGLPLENMRATLQKAAALPQFQGLPKLNLQKAAPVVALSRETIGAPGFSDAPQFAGGPTSPLGVLADVAKGAGTTPNAPQQVDEDERADRATLHARLGRAGAMAGAAISGTKADTQFWDDLAAEPQQRLAQMKSLLAKKAELDAKQRAEAEGLAFDRERFAETVRHNKATEEAAAKRGSGGGLSPSLAYRMGRDQMEDERRRQERADNKQTTIDAEQRKKAAAMADVEERARNIDNSLAELEKLVDADGTYEMFGPHNERLEALITSYATDMAKLRDPTSVAREGEVALEKKAMFEPGSMRLANDTALTLIRDARKRAAERRNEAYRVRGLDAPPLAAQSPVLGLSPEEAAEFAELEKKYGGER